MKQCDKVILDRDNSVMTSDEYWDKVEKGVINPFEEYQNCIREYGHSDWHETYTRSLFK